MTVAENEIRINRLEDDVQKIDERLANLESMHVDMMARLDVIVKMGRAIMGLIGVGLGIDLGLEKMMYRGEIMSETEIVILVVILLVIASR